MNPIFLLIVVTFLVFAFAIRRFLVARDWFGLLGIVSSTVAIAASIGAWHAYMVVDSLALALTYGAVAGLGVIGAMRWLLPTTLWGR
ncbi:MAG: hypothetical protein CMO55_01915 [Verrucomicrobiales bacterium]|nr:hypothetical protein [Verrucomicrobiales bacterium]